VDRDLSKESLISPSGVFFRDHRELRSLTRSRENLVKFRTKLKNWITHELEAAWIKLSTVLSDIFSKSGRHIVDGLTNGIDLEDILETIPSKKVRANKEEIRGIIHANLSSSQIFLLRSHLDTVDSISNQIAEIDVKISDSISFRKDDLQIALSMPGMGIVSASTILAEIGDSETL
jgi:transposase